MKKVDAIIVGQGLAGTSMALSLMERGRKVCVIDPKYHKDHSFLNASRSAAGLFNPITGRKMVKTWMADSLFSGLANFYQKLEAEWSVSFYYEAPIYRPFQSVEDQNDWVGSEEDESYSRFIKQVYTDSIGLPGYIDPFGGLLLEKSGYLDVPTFLDAAESQLQREQAFLTASVKYSNFHYAESKVFYDDDVNKVEARWVIYCTGVEQSESNPWANLKFRPVKGEWLTLDMIFDPNYILNRGVFMIPREGVVRVGATYDHSSLDRTPTIKAQKDIIERMHKIYRGEYRILDQKVGIRPATYDRKPFVGVHPHNSKVAILNGLGAKGVTLAPYFAEHLADHLLEGTPLLPEVDVLRCF
ncbi:MAG: NAD(P)/FAD-dependent oxidoreductase [Cyclobacteriaceae bacterium]